MKRYAIAICLILIACSTQNTLLVPTVSAGPATVAGQVSLASSETPVVETAASPTAPAPSEVPPTPEPVAAATESIKTESNEQKSASTLPIVPTGRLSNWSCDVLIEKASDLSFTLKGLAALVAKKRCNGFSFDVKSLSDLERRIFSERIEELNPTSSPTSASLSIDDVKKKLKLAKSSSEKYKAYKQLRSKQKNLGRRADFVKTTADMYAWAKKEYKKKKTTESISYYYETAQLYARTFWTEDRLGKANEILDEALNALKANSSVAEIYFLQARMAEEKLDLDRAVALFDLAAMDAKTHKPKTLSFNVDRILWLKSWILFKEKKWAEAEKSLQNLAETTLDLSEKSRAQFYRARSLAHQGKKDESKVILESITAEDFFGYYGLVAYYELGRKLPALSKIKFEKQFPFDLELGFLKSGDKTLFQDLIQYQELDLAERAVAVLSKSPENSVNLGLYLANKGSRFLPLFAAFSKLDNNSRMEMVMTHGNLLFPQPHQQQVKMMAEKTSLPSSLIYSIMKQESAFNERTRSHADAMGLMQLIPRLAKQLSKKFSIGYRDPQDLFNPEINIQLGSFELMEQVKKQSGQLTFVAAAYNAGPNALNGWLKTRSRNDILEFIEEIPYEETRTYVKLIARNKLFYERISKRDEEHSFPAEFLQWSDSKKTTAANN